MERESIPIAKVKFKYDKLFIPKWVQAATGIKNDNTYTIYLTDQRGHFLLKETAASRRRAEAEEKREKMVKAGNEYMEQAIRLAAAKDKDPEELEKLKAAFDEKIKNLKEGKE